MIGKLKKISLLFTKAPHAVRRMHPPREWLIGIVLALCVLLVGIPYVALLFFSALNEEYTIDDPAPSVVYENEAVRDALARFEYSVPLPLPLEVPDEAEEDEDEAQEGEPGDQEVSTEEVEESEVAEVAPEQVE